MSRSTSHKRLATALLIVGLAAPAGAQAATAPAVSQAPGRVVFPVDSGARVDNVDSGGAEIATPLPDGSTLLFGFGTTGRDSLKIAKIAHGGALDRSFGAGGIATLATPGSLRYTFTLSQVLRQADGKLLLLSAKQPDGSPPLARSHLRVMRLNADATLDPSYGVGGTTETAINEGCGSLCSSAALQPDGSLVLAGSTGEVPAPPAPPDLHWALTRLTPSGAVDPGFGTAGIATIATPGGSTTGLNVAIGADGTIVTDAQSQVGASSKMLLIRLTSAGAPDPTFAGGTPADAPIDPGFLMLAQDDGSVVLDGRTPGSTTVTSTAGHSLLVRHTPAGTLDGAFGSSGVVDLGTTVHPTQLLPISGRAVLVVGAGGPHLNVKLVTADGLFAPLLGGAAGRNVDPAFGGGGSSFLVSVKPRPVASVAQNSFLERGDSAVVRRTDGSYLVAGGVHVSQPTGEGAGYSIGRFAAAALTASLTPDTTFGGPASTPRLSVKLSHQRAATARSRHGIRVQLKASAPGLVRVKISHGRRAIAYGLLPVFKTSSHTLPVELTSYGDTYLRNHRNVRVSITANGRDLLASPMKTSAVGRLR
jgi:uncharacterized delta-60 repeat protein